MELVLKATALFVGGIVLPCWLFIYIAVFIIFKFVRYQ